ncbi:MAG: glycerate dehydrogenase [Chloroflexi bacterium]|nr:glycerate dehydrogenase [Chloroflexota bacterium]
MTRIVVVDDHPSIAKGTIIERRLQELGEVAIYTSLATKPELLIERLRDAEVAIVERTSSRVTAEVLAHASRLKHIAVYGIGVDNVDLDYCRKRSIMVTNTPGYSAPVVAEAAIALALAVLRRIPQYDDRVRAGLWQDPGQAPGQLYGKTLGVVGTGNIGAATARLGLAHGMKVIAWTLHPSAERARELGIEYVSLEDLMRTADVVSISLRHTPQSEKLINGRLLGLMKPTAVLVNTARGPIVDQEALVEVLRQRRIRGAGLDVFTPEPLPAGHPLCEMDNVVLSPHIAAATPEMALAGMGMAVDNIRNALEGHPTHVVA